MPYPLHIGLSYLETRCLTAAGVDVTSAAGLEPLHAALQAGGKVGAATS
jgi:hypothetical protein